MKSAYFLLFRRKIKAFKQQRAAFYRILLTIGFLITPVLLLFAPVPGFLVYSSNIMSLPFIVGSAILYIVALINHLFASLMFNKEEHLWFKYVFNGTLPINEQLYLIHCRVYLFAPVTLAGLIKVEQFTPTSILSFALSVVCVFFAAKWTAARIIQSFSRQLTTKQLSLHLKVFRLLTFSALNTLIAWLASALLATYFAFSMSSTLAVKGYIFVLLSLAIVFLALSYRSMHKNIRQHSITLRYFDVSLPGSLSKRLKNALFIAIVLTIISPNIVYFMH